MEKYATYLLHRIAVLFSVVTIASVMLTAHAGSHLHPDVTISKAQGEQCVLPADEIRKVHPDLLKHDRIATMRNGIRKDTDENHLKGSIKACINCHAIKENEKYVRIDNPKHFCSSCHIYAGVTFDCFQCHRDIPEN